MFIIPIKIIKFNKKERLGGNWNRLDCVSIWCRNKQPKNNSEVSVPPRTNEKYKRVWQSNKTVCFKLGVFLPLRNIEWEHLKGSLKPLQFPVSTQAYSNSLHSISRFSLLLQGRNTHKQIPRCCSLLPATVVPHHHCTHPRPLNSHHSWHTDHLHTWWKY